MLSSYIEGVPKVKNTLESSIELAKKFNDRELFGADRKLIQPYIYTRKHGDWKYKTIVKEYAYFAAASHIHFYFLNNTKEIENHEENTTCIYKINKSDLEKLLKTCNQILKNREEANNILPLHHQFHLGRFAEEKNEYEISDFKDIKKCKKACEELIKKFNFERWFLYYRSLVGHGSF